MSCLALQLVSKIKRCMRDLGCNPDRCCDRWMVELRRALRRNTARLSVTVGLCCLSVNTAVANPSAHASYVVSSGCPSRAQFLEEVLARSPAAAHASVRSILALSAVSMTVRDRATYGTLRLPAGEVREVVGNSCTEVAGALALVVALKARAEAPFVRADEPSSPAGAASTSAGSAPAPADASAAGAEGVPANAGAASASAVPANANAEASHVGASPASGGSATASAGSSPAGAASTLPPQPPQPEQAVSRRVPSSLGQASIQLFPKAPKLSSKPAPETRWTLGAGAMAAFGPAPVGLFGAALFAEYQSTSFFPHLVLLGAEAAPYASARVQAATARYQWWASHADACAQALRFEASTALWLCAEVVGGLALVTGQVQGPITHARTAREGWLSAGPAARIRVELAESYSLDFAASVGVPVVRHRTVFSEPDWVLHETGNLAGFLLLQLARHSGG